MGDSSRKGYSTYECRCGTVKEVLDSNVQRGQSNSCGCFKTDMLRARNKRVAVLSHHLVHTELAWAAGFWDGEGCTSGTLDKRVALRAPRPRVTMALSQSGDGAEEILLRFQRAVGGLGHVRGPYDPGEGMKPVWRWSTQGHELCQAILALLWPYLSNPKRQQAVARLRTVRHLD